MAFDFVFAVFPGILVLTALFGVFDVPVEAFTTLLHDMGVVVPEPLIGVVETNLQHASNSSQSLLFVGILGVLWPASASLSTTMAALNRAYGTKERRTIFLRRSLSVILIVGFGLALVVLFNLSVFSAQFDRWLASHWALSLELPSLSSLVRHTAGVTGTLVVAATVYRIAPDTPLRWLDVLPGSLLFLVLWTLIAGGFGFYVKFFGYYSVVYGVLWGVIVLLLSAYLVAFFLLLGGELNGTLYRRRQASFLERTDKPDPS